MVRIIGLREDSYNHITEVNPDAIAYQNDNMNCIEFCEFCYVNMQGDHVEIKVTNPFDYDISICIGYADFWRIEIE